MLHLLGEVTSLESHGATGLVALTLGGLAAKFLPAIFQRLLSLPAAPQAKVAQQCDAPTETNLPIAARCGAHGPLETRMTILETATRIEIPAVKRAVEELTKETRSGFKALHNRLTRMKAPAADKEGDD